MTEQPVELTVQVGLEDGEAEEVDTLARQLTDDLLELDVETAQLAAEGAAPDGTKSAEAVTLGAIALVVLPVVLPKILEFLQEWVLRGRGRTIKFKGKVDGKPFEFEGTVEDMKSLLALLEPKKPAARS